MDFALFLFKALFVNFVAIQCELQLISWYIVVKTPVRRKEKSCSFFSRVKPLYTGEKSGTWDFSESSNICENSLI
ncbi:hypothetical protein D3H55_16435 [Bacillus salacetis]|uniref:Uncharacterized protein n=1 Tax=Bacillus salacetis TaxID=2315464 RepID=A0A3A1QT06_9BACI|nr:hypothetical protein D3H55_16435 [Bacillus salacetis]